jgi:CBS-domain-containing membrane protein
VGTTTGTMATATTPGTTVPDADGTPGATDPPATTDPTLVGRLVARGQRGFVTISFIDTAAVAVSIGALVAINQVAAPDNLPFLVASFASSAVVLFSLPGLDIARTWNVVGGQFLGALSGFLCVTVLGDGHLAVVAGCSVAVAYALMQLCRALHPPGAATALIVAVQPTAQGVKFLFFPVLAGSIFIVVFAWAVRFLEARLMVSLRAADRADEET